MPSPSLGLPLGLPTLYRTTEPHTRTHNLRVFCVYALPYPRPTPRPTPRPQTVSNRTKASRGDTLFAQRVKAQRKSKLMKMFKVSQIAGGWINLAILKINLVFVNVGDIKEKQLGELMSRS